MSERISHQRRYMENSISETQWHLAIPAIQAAIVASRHCLCHSSLVTTVHAATTIEALRLKMKDFPHTQDKEEPGPLLHEFKLYIDLSRFVHSEVPGDYSKRVYQGVRVKHTVKDLLAEKRSRQTSNSRFNFENFTIEQRASIQVSHTTAKVPISAQIRICRTIAIGPVTVKVLSCSPVMSGYYGVRRSFLSDSDFHNTKFANDTCTSSVSKPFPCESSAVQSHPALLDSYFPEPYGDHRSPALTPNTGSLFSASPLPPLLPPPFSSDPTHFVLRDSWEQTVPDALSQLDPVPTDALQNLPPSTSCLSQLEVGSTPQHRSSSWGAPLAGAQSYSLHALEDLYHTPGYPTPPPYPFTPFTTMSNDPPPKVVPLSPDEGADTSTLQDPSLWTKEDGSMAWGSYEFRRAY
ncbi:uncharacterized protein C11orf53 homolog [Pteropus alecto]|uniref:uncharacterized protein C11orf53 homolog n=1 Tax=Pteropus alecto TaxID=9402 RepID=UPI0007688F1A|nr:uncharacterized protein C11orf53 homolog [Pteropus alecto]